MGGAVKDQLGRVQTETGGGPAVILVGPQLGENIGAAARAMLNFGLTDLRLVALESAGVFETTAEAVADLSFILAATARRRELEIPVIGTGEVGAALHAHEAAGTRTGILFGPEKAGLKNEDVVLCNHILTYPINPAFQSLNLAQAVGVFGYIWKSGEGTAPPPAFDTAPSEAASREDLVRMFEHLEDELEKSGFFFPADKKLLMSRNIRAPFTRANMTDQEVRTFRGIIKALSKGRGPSRKS